MMNSMHNGKVPHQSVDSRFMPSVLLPRQRAKYIILILIWFASLAYFWGWWLRPEHNIGTGRFILISIAIFWVHFLLIYFISFFMNVRATDKGLKALGPYRVGMVVTKTPSEPFSVLKVTLKAMLRQDLPHDTWLADEDPTEETIQWCRENGVFISTRKDCPEYHQKTWPRRTRCKEGNLAYFYDHYGYERYDFVSQLDADHVPEPTYLRKIVEPFYDPAIGYVSAPSICSSNAKDSWSARMRLFAEAMFHGGIQAGYSNGWAPVCIGSHYAVRTRALKDIGGLGPELAEDHSTTMIMNSGGWRGVHVINAIAIGEGPATITDLVTQEFQWSRSLTTLLLQYTPRYIGSLPARIKFQFVFWQLWYPLSALFMLLMYCLPIVALLFDIRIANVTFLDFWMHSLPLVAIILVIVYNIRKDGFFRPYDAKFFSWEKALFGCAQWPWVAWGCTMAVYDLVSGKFVDFRITPKGESGTAQLPAKVLIPYFVLAIGSLLPVLFTDNLRDAAGFYILTLVNSIFYTVLFVVIVMKHMAENKASWTVRPIVSGLQLATAIGLVGLTATSFMMRGPESVYALSYGMTKFKIAEAKFIVSGAGQVSAGRAKYKFVFEWNEEQRKIVQPK